MFNECGYVLFLLLLVHQIESARRLNEYISHYEPLSYDRRDVHRSHLRARRSVSQPESAVQLQFRAHGRHFRLRLRRDTSTFSDKLEVHGSSGQPIQFDASHVYNGHLIGEPNSEVWGSLSEGVFEGKIVSPKGSFYVEKARHYFPHHPNRTFHSVIYNENHVEDPYRDVREGHVGGCGVTDDVVQWMDRVQNSAVEEVEPPPQPLPRAQALTYGKAPPAPKPEGAAEARHVHFYEEPSRKYSREVNEDRSQRWKRANGRQIDENKNTCSLYIQTDPFLWRHIREGFPEHRDPSKEEEVNEKTKEEILSLIAHHVTAVNYIYRDTKFDGKIEHRNIKFEVQRIKIDDDLTCKCNSSVKCENPFCQENIDVSNFLNIHSLGNHEDFCLAYVFTYRDFMGGTLGLAWVASASGASGGICEKYKTYTETVAGMYMSTRRSLNTGIITFVNYNSRVPPKVSQLTLAHEIGHNFGSPHDYPAECRPGGVSGNYIMFASATSGDRPNNSKFSSCSIGNISNVLDAIVDSKKRNCFTASEGAFCGNKIVEEGEECDCGYDDKECNDQCCYPRIISRQDFLLNSSALSCQRRRDTQCSPSQGPCCSNRCSFIPSIHRSVCKPETDCSLSSVCNGTSAECPEPLPMEDKKSCNNGTQLCIRGDCAGSMCLLWNMEECFLTSQIPNIDKRRLCELACLNRTDNSCRSTSEFARSVGLPTGGISLRPGSPCDNFQGYCDVFLKCRAVDAEGPLVRLMNLLLNKETLLNVALWVTEFWWAVVLMGIGFLLIMGLFIKCCAVHTPSSNPKKPPARRIGETLRRPVDTLRRMRHHGRHHQGHHPVVPGHARRQQQHSSRPSGSSGPSRGYGEGRSQHYQPKASAPPMNAPSGRGRGDQYSGAYEMRPHKV